MRKWQLVDARARWQLGELKEMKLKAMELETKNEMCTHQTKRLDEECHSLGEKLRDADQKEEVLQRQVRHSLSFCLPLVISDGCDRLSALEWSR